MHSCYTFHSIILSHLFRSCRYLIAVYVLIIWTSAGIDIYAIFLIYQLCQPHHYCIVAVFTSPLLYSCCIYVIFSNLLLTRISKSDNIHERKMVLPIRKIEDTKGVIRSSKSKDRQYNGHTKMNKQTNNGHTKMDKRTNNDLQNTTQKTKDRSTRNPLNTRDETRCSG